MKKQTTTKNVHKEENKLQLNTRMRRKSSLPPKPLPQEEKYGKCSNAQEAPLRVQAEAQQSKDPRLPDQVIK